MPYFSAQIPITFSQALCARDNSYQTSTPFPRCTTSVSLHPPFTQPDSILTISRPKFRPTMTMSPAWMSLHQTCLSALVADPIYFISHLFHCMARNSHGGGEQEDNSKTTPKMLQYNIHPTASFKAHIPTISTPAGAWNTVRLNKHHWASLLLALYLIKLGLLHPQANSRWAATSAVCAENSV